MKKDICGIEVIASYWIISTESLEDSCIYAESLVEKIKTATGYDPLNGIENIVIYTEMQKPETKKLIIALKNQRTKQFERRDIVVCNYASKAGLCHKDSIHFDAELFNPLDSNTFIHELGHNIHRYLPREKKLDIAKKHSALKKELIKRIKEGANPGEAANNIFLEYAFLHEYEFLKEDLICFEGYVGILNRIVKILPADSAEAAIKAYTFHGDDREFFAEMFSVYFHEREKLAEKGLLDFAEKIIKKRN